MPVRMICVALCWLVSAVASAQVSVLCRTPADEELARTLARLTAQPVAAVPASDGDATEPFASARAGEWVSIDRERSTIVVYSVTRRATLSRVLDADVMSASSYAVALATAELLEWFDASAGARAGLPSGRAAPSSNPSPNLGLGADLEIQSQPGYSLSSVRPSIHAELTWGRARTGGFWAVGARASIPGSRVLQVAAVAAPDGRARLEVLGTDAAVQLTLGHGMGRLALTSQLAAGISYVGLQAFDTSGDPLGNDEQLSPLFAGGLGFRYSVLFGFALAASVEAQWAGPRTVYRMVGDDVLETGALRVGLFAGVLWEGALAGEPSEGR
jgi:hypothetical protein